MKKFNTIKTYVKFPKNIQVIVISEGICALAFGMYGFLQILYLNYINISPGSIGVIFSVGSLSSLLGFAIGPFVKLVGRKTILAMGCLLAAIGIAQYIFFTRFIILLFGQILINIGICFMQVTELQLLYSYTTPDKECCAYSYKFSINFIASAIGGLIAGNINRLELFKNVGYKHLFFISSILLIATFIIRLLFLPKDEREISKQDVIGESIKITLYLLKEDKKIQIFSIFLFLLSVGGSAIWPYNNLIMKDTFLLSNTTISIIGFVITTLNMVGLMNMPHLIEKFSINALEIFLFIVLTLSNFSLSLKLNTMFFIGFLILRCLAAGLMGSSLDSSMMSHINLENRDIFAGVKILVNGVSVAIGNFIGGILLNKFSYRINYIYGCIFLLASITFFYFKVRSYLTNRELNNSCNCHFNHQHIQYKR